MIKFYTNRELSEKLDVNIAKWKRWSREFLPPDPLGGMQSGYARQYTTDDSLTVYLGGHLVSELKYTIPEAKIILNDLQKWLMNNGFYINSESKRKYKENVNELITKHIIYIIRAKNSNNNSNNFFYRVRGIISDKPIDYRGFKIREERYVEISMGQKGEGNTTYDMKTAKILNITEIHRYFKVCLADGTG